VLGRTPVLDTVEDEEAAVPHGPHPTNR
jgi:hypothetical protein